MVPQTPLNRQGADPHHPDLVYGGVSNSTLEVFISFRYDAIAFLEAGPR